MTGARFLEDKKALAHLKFAACVQVFATMLRSQPESSACRLQFNNSTGHASEPMQPRLVNLKKLSEPQIPARKFTD